MTIYLFPTSDKPAPRLDDINWDTALGQPHGYTENNGVREPANDPAADKINPDHYRKLPMEAIEITEHFNFCLGNALKYIIRCEHKGDKKADLAKAIWYLQREMARG